MSRPPLLTPDDAERARRRYVDEKLPVHLLAHAFGVSESTMNDVLMGKGAYAGDAAPVKAATKRNRGNQKLDDNDVRDIRRKRDNGAGFEDLAVEYGVHPTTIMKVTTWQGRFSRIDPINRGTVAQQRRKPRPAENDRLEEDVETMIAAGRSADDIVALIRSRI
ncbi:hypothetical protein ANMWB30_24110 [Arthrobacter sp. MWB30]|nr:hypothetical protein ANMWB30_24110 [Arthrobacter sp. MWB30]